MMQRHISIVDNNSNVVLFLIPARDDSPCNDPVTAFRPSEETLEHVTVTKVDLDVIDQCLWDLGALDIARPFIMNLFTQIVQQADPPSPTERVLTTRIDLRKLPASHIVHESPVPLTLILNSTGNSSQERDNPQIDLTCLPADLLRSDQGHIKRFPGYLQTFNLHHIPP